jgi:hypothetical protein
MGRTKTEYIIGDKGELLRKVTTIERLKESNVEIKPVSELGFLKSTEFDIISDAKEMFVLSENKPKKILAYFKKHFKVTIRDDQKLWFLKWNEGKLFVFSVNNENGGVLYAYGFASDEQQYTQESEEIQIDSKEANEIYKAHPKYFFRKADKFGRELGEIGYKNEILDPDQEQR